jgi:histidyl-tRNA synthetase
VSFSVPKGFNDVLPGGAGFLDASLWQPIADITRETLEGWGYRYAWLPIAEHTEVFARGIGEATDVVSKEMYTFADRGGRSLTLRPEGTAGAVRAYIEGGFAPQHQRWWYQGPMFRAERPQKGRYRQFYQFGGEHIGPDSVAADVEMLLLLTELCTRLELAGVSLHVNTLGDAESRAHYRATLLDYLQRRQGELCETCRGRLEQNPLRTLDCKRCKTLCGDAPALTDSLSAAAAARWQQTLGLLAECGVAAAADPHLVRGLDYYTGLLFEFRTDQLGAQDTLIGGGRYDGLVRELGGPDVPAIGFAAGMERIALLRACGAPRRPLLFLCPMPGFDAVAFSLAARWRAHLAVVVDVGGGKLKQQLRRADRSGATWALVIGEDEAARGAGTIKNLATGSQKVVQFESMPGILEGT